MAWLDEYSNETNRHILQMFLNRPPNDQFRDTSGLQANLMHFIQGETSCLFNTENSHIRFDEVLEKNLICYFQLPTMYYPFLGEATGKLVLQAFQNAVAKRHLGMTKNPSFFSCFLDDFQDYIYSGFSTLLNKSRSANIGVVFSHQALGDLDKVGPHFRNQVSTNTNIKIVMRPNDPETTDHYAKVIGTKTTEKVTERQQRQVLGTSKTGEGSTRQVEEYIVHPTEIRTLARGQGIVAIPHNNGVKIKKLRFKMAPELKTIALPPVEKCLMDLTASFQVPLVVKSETKT
jgi:hypothetical protein